ncbi:MAG TPA: IPTL-CTERM sorting domain-containing protein, partial [Xanthomonadales bacterium]|nr:IPTL-CTERM sorting domain-containing protein [Xanthomonadales bacterium]
NIPQNNLPYPTGNLQITNTGDPGSNLSGTCSFQTGGGAIQFTTGSGGAYSLATGASKNVGVQCNSTFAPGVYVDTVSCTHNDPNSSNPAVYPFTCEIDQPDPAQFGSNPASGQTIDITGGTPVAEGTTPAPTAPLQMTNTAPLGDASMDLTCGLVNDVGSAISVNTAVTNAILAPGASQNVSFSCDTTTAGSYSATYSCNWDSVFVSGVADGADGPQGEIVVADEEYTVTCEVRAGVSDVTPDPADGTPQVGAVAPGGSASFFFDFDETAGEGVDATLISCALDSGTDFQIISPLPGDFPVTIPADGSVQVEVQGTDPGGVTSFSDTLRCIYNDSDSDDVEVSYLLTLNVGGDARFTVLKDFTDGNPGEVTVAIDCNTGLILDQDKVITEDGIGVTFVVTDYTAGNLACNVKEQPVAGYSADYEASGDSASSDVDDPAEDAGCYWTEIEGGVENLCVITNEPDTVNVVINKEWLYPGSADASIVSDEFSVVVYCSNAHIVDGDEYCGLVGTADAAQSEIISLNSCKYLSGSGDTSFNVGVVPHTWPGGQCYAYEVDVDQAVEVENGCASAMAVSAGSGNSCTITNTVFFEGIPTLSQYGMMLMALLMLGVGFVAVRRIS